MGGESVSLTSQERLDLPDALALQALVYEYVQRALSGLLGPSEGCLTSPPLTASSTASTSTISVGECLLAFAEASGAVRKLGLGTVIRHDPTLSSQVSDIAVTAFVGSACYLWAREVDLATDNDSRVFWDSIAGAPTTAPVNTRTRTRVEFAATNTATGAYPGAAGDGWFRFAYVPAGGWVANGAGNLDKVGTVYPISPFDLESPGHAAVGKHLGGLRLASTFNTPGAAAGLNWIIGTLQSVVTAILDTSASDDPTLFDIRDAPARGLAQIESAVQTLETLAAKINARLTTYNWPVVVGYLSWNGSAYSWTSYGPLAPTSGPTRVAAGHVTMTFSGVLYAAQVTVVDRTGSAPYFATTEVSNSSPAGDLDVRIYDAAGAAVDADVYVAAYGEPL